MKYVVCIPDGCSDLPSATLDGRTPLEVADMPVLAGLAARGTLGRAAVIPDGFPPGSDVGNMSIFGYDPSQFHTGRAPIEAAALGLRLSSDQIAYRCNLVTVGGDDTMVDFAGGHPESDVAAEIIRAVDAELGGEVRFHPGVSYRHAMVAPATWADADCPLPHDLTDQPIQAPSGPAAAQLLALMEASRDIVARFDTAATQIWLWGQGHQPELEDFVTRFGVTAGLVTAVDLVRGLGVLTGIDIHEVPGATGWFDTDYEGKRDCALDALAAGTDLFMIHVEATDEAGHAGSAIEKIRSLENWDSLILDGLVKGLDAQGPWRMLLMPDHATPIDLKTHVPDAVPYLLVDSEHDGPGGTYTEAGVAAAPAVAGHRLMGMLIDPQSQQVPLDGVS